MRAALLFAVAFALAGCPSEYWGDPDAEAEVEAVSWSSGSYTELSGDGAALPLLAAPQGGYVWFIGARVHNFAGGLGIITARIRDPADGRIYAFETRQVPFDEPVPGRSEWGQSNHGDLANVANVPACPNYQSRALVDLPWRLELEVIDREGKRAVTALTGVPRCEPGDDYCAELCGAAP